MAHILFHFDKQYVCLHCHLWFYTRRTVMQHANHFHSRITIPIEDPANMPPGSSGEDYVEEPLVVEPIIDLPADHYAPASSLIYDPSSYFEPPPIFLDASAIVIPAPSPSASPEKKPSPSKQHPFPCSSCSKSYKTRNGLIRHEKDAHGLMRPPRQRAVNPAATATAVVAQPHIPVLVPQVVNGVVNGDILQLIPVDVDQTIEIVVNGFSESSELQPVRPKRRRKEPGVIIPRRPKAAPSLNTSSSNPRRKTPTSSSCARRKSAAAAGNRQLKILPDSELNESGKKRPSTINGWVDGKVHHKENGINNRMLHERAKADAEDAEIGQTRKLYCKNSKWKRLQEEREEEERRRRNDPKLSMSCFVQLTDIFKCYVHMEEAERNGMTIFR